MSEYWLGFATPLALVLAFIVFTEIVGWFRWWWADPRSRLGRGHQHDFDSRDDGKWYPSARHTHWWPPGTPWWLIRWLEPIRVWLCLRDPDHRPATRP